MDGVEEELRVLYVALTRPSCCDSRVEEQIRGLWQTRQGRWCTSEGGRRLSEVEVFGSDADHLDPPCAGEIECDARLAQEHIRDQVASGDDLSLELHRRSLGGRPLPLYKIVHRRM